jgi:hypothetical protein
MDDGQIVKNPSMGNRKPGRHLEGRRFNPYNRLKKNVQVTSTEGEQGEQRSQFSDNEQRPQGKGAVSGSDRDDEML